MNGAVIVAAGKGLRMDAEVPKQFLNILDRPVVVHTLQRFIQAGVFSEIVLVVPDNYRDYARGLLQPYRPLDRVKLVEGSQKRQESVYRGLLTLPQSVETACIHDGVRPMVSISLIKRVLSVAERRGAAVPAVALKDTIKEVDQRGNVAKTLDREKYRLIQTPQCFTREVLVKAHEDAYKEGREATDDASLVEYTGAPVAVVEGESENIKITIPEDLVLAEMFLEKRNEHV